MNNVVRLFLGIVILGFGTYPLAQTSPARAEYQLTLVGLDGKRTPVGKVSGSTFAPRVSPDGREVAFDTNDDGAIWIAKVQDLTAKRMITTEGRNRAPLWSRDGKRVLYVTDHEGAETLFWRAADGTGTGELLTKPARAPESWHPKLGGFSYITFKDGGDYDVWTYAVAEKKASPFAAIAGSPQHSSYYSPDGRWLAYVSSETGRLEVYVRRTEVSGPAIQVTKNGGGHPQWSPDQETLFFDNQGQVFSVDLRPAGEALAVGTPVGLPISGFIQGPLRRQYDLMPDGRQFLMLFRQ